MSKKKEFENQKIATSVPKMSRSISAQSLSRNIGLAATAAFTPGENLCLLPNRQSIGVFRTAGISQSATPVSRKFAPGYYTTHSLAGNNMIYKSEVSIKKLEKSYLTNHVPMHENLIKDMNA